MFVYLPKFTGPKSLAGLQSFGLDALHDPGLSLESGDVLANGPDGGHGVLFGWGQVGRMTAYRPERQEWHKLAPRADGQEAWLGWDVDQKPNPETLARRKQVGSRVVKLGDGGYWLIPTVDAMPKVVGLDAAGKVSARLQSDWEAFVNDTESFLKKFHMEEDAMFIDLEAGFSFVAAALAKNYRLTPELISILGLIRHDDFAVIPATVLRCDLLAEAA